MYRPATQRLEVMIHGGSRFRARKATEDHAPLDQKLALTPPLSSTPATFPHPSH